MWLVGWFPGSVHRRVSSFSSFFWRVIVVVWNFLVQGSRGPGVVVLAAAAAASHACLQHHNRTRQGGVLRCVASCPMPSIHPSTKHLTMPVCLPHPPTVFPLPFIHNSYQVSTFSNQQTHSPQTNHSARARQADRNRFQTLQIYGIGNRHPPSGRPG